MVNRLSETLFKHAGRNREEPSSTAMPDPEQLADTAKQWLHQAKEAVASNPGAGMAVALGAGILLGWWVKRK